MKRISTLFLFIVFSGQLFAQVDEVPTPADTSYWLKEIGGGMNLNQASFSGNWQGGGVNSIALGFYLNGRANYAKDKWSWDNTMDFIYGIVKNKDEEGRKSNDRIFLDTKVGYQINDKWNYFFAINFLSQFAPGYEFPEDQERIMISKFLNPAYLTTSLGVEYKPNDEFSLRISPFSPRWTFVTDTELYQDVPNNYGVEIGEKVRTEWLALSILADYNKKLSENLSLMLRYQMYANYETFAFDAIDHRLDVGLTAKVSNFVNVSLTSLSIYDLDQDSKIQFSQGLALGIAFKQGNFPEKE
ncbi:DUF3078 domain-containing protein [Algoriphagus halophytocola]|uniref:DUF3078 domain-containing protein n=1 Tax=Algoriphagus halophytocola TaxID=2991499 RepID=A0ABY6MJD1_9BACT|nr:MULTISPECIES: DUF3078 domain-containing protein [unclassified Algoriphagus]UZD23278.1 DUF3078 domain-containing protein [Algoriphagus sp. TR-M5]WBL44572.1 DUF3078 domain-containing protein [Algoriphagus sp. TR-M9]